MNLLLVIDLLCDITTKQSALLRKLVTELEHMEQVSKEVKTYYRTQLDVIEDELDIAEYRNRDIPIIEDGFKEGSK